jgi:hypothetical protein
MDMTHEFRISYSLNIQEFSLLLPPLRSSRPTGGCRATVVPDTVGLVAGPLVAVVAPDSKPDTVAVVLLLVLILRVPPLAPPAGEPCLSSFAEPGAIR